jgi:Nucleoside 2-deoxyribosyltransferase like
METIAQRAVLYPPTRSDDGGNPVVFLAGPIAGAPDWHKGAIDRLACAATERGVGDFTIACPRPPNWTLAKHSSFAEFEKNEIWEQEHIEKAMRQGVLVFWLAREVVHQYGRAYAQTCRFQLGESLALLYCNFFRGGRIVVGIDPAFYGKSYIRWKLTERVPQVPICTTLDETIVHTADALATLFAAMRKAPA